MKLSSSHVTPVTHPAEQPGTAIQGEVSNPLSGARTTVYFSAARMVSISYFDYGSAIGKELRIVFNALDDNDADARAISPGARNLLKLNNADSWRFDENNPGF